MTIKGLRKEINESKHKDFFKNCTVHINYPHIDFSADLKGIDAIYGFVLRQNQGWSNKELPSYLNNSKEHFKKLKSQILDLVKEDHYHIEGKWRQIKTQIEKGEINNRAKVFTPNSSITKFLEDLYKENSNYADSAYNFFIGRKESIDSLNVVGLIRAYEFKNQGRTDVVKRRSNEKAAISTIRNSFEDYISETEVEINKVLDDSKEKLIGQTTEIDQLLELKKVEFEEWFNTSKTGFTEFDKESEKSITNLEKTYQEKLKLEEPAKYWSDRSEKLKKQGWIALSILVVIILIVVFSLGKLLWTTPEQIYESFFNGDKSAAIRWSIIYITFISFMAFAIRAVTKVMFSSFHLARDCEERHTLTYFYLSLLKDSTVDKEDKKLIMQALFSRAETGLLKNDASPTMPNDIIGKFMSK